MDNNMLEDLLRVQMGLGLADGLAAPAVRIEEEDEDPSQSDWMSMDDLVRAHALLRASSEHAFPDKITVSFLHPMSAEGEGSKSSTPVRKLQPMLVGDLQVGWHHKGRVLYGELSVEPFKMVAVHTMVADESGQEVKLCVYNALPRKHSPQQMWELFPKGLKVAIKEPYFKVAVDGSHIIRVDNPADFIRNPKIRKASGSRNNSTSTSTSTSPSPSTSTSPSPSPLWSKVLLDAGDLRSRGNQAFAGQDWKQAIQLYTDTVQVLLKSRGLSSSAISSEVSKELVLAFSNRAEARLRLKHFEAANVDAGKALKLQPNHVKSLYRKGRALHGLHLYKEAVLCFNEALNVTDKNDMSIKDLTEALKASEICNKQARTGEYDLVRLWREVEGGKEPVCGEFIGPVEIGPAKERALGRGLLVTRDVEPGDLLLVSNAIAHGKAYHSSSMRLLQQGSRSKDIAIGHNVYHQELTQQVLDRAMSSARFREQVYSLAANSTTGMGGIEMDIPSMDLFLAKSESTRCDDASLNLEDIDDDKICGVIKTNAFFEDDCEDGEEFHAALWLLPSFINHSCTPNSCWMKLGKEALFVRAAHHVTKGQEVTISYIERVAVPYSARAPLFQHCRGFDCRCERCNFEKSLEPFTKTLETKSTFLPLDASGAAEVVESLEWAFQNTLAFKNEKQKRWLRTSYFFSFLATLLDSSLQQRMSKFAPLETVLMAVHETLGGSETILALVRSKLHDSECSPRVKGLFLTMCVCLYGKQPPATLRVLLGLRGFMM